MNYEERMAMDRDKHPRSRITGEGFDFAGRTHTPHTGRGGEERESREEEEKRRNRNGIRAFRLVSVDRGGPGHAA